jgi:hypothetical protein
MNQSLYDPARILARAQEWRAEAEAATIPEMRDFCLQQALRCESLVNRSLDTAVLNEPTLSHRH